MPTKARSPETIECLKDDEGVSFQLTKFRACNNEDLFLSFHFEISIADVGGPDIKIIELGQEDKEADSTKGNNSRVNAIKQDLSKMSISNKPALVASIVLHIKDKVNTNLPVTFWGLSSLA